ncbi:hypothetical protein GGR56DRAFT_574165 [Xylariaceae sp. FL0804]|nr:hypothetical protein GGR56DRAFT_574165 [Xylariaceae sp. FL0804]
MANSLALLKNLPCPAGGECTAFKCLFKHEDSGANMTIPTLTPTKLPSSALPDHQPPSPSANQDLPRKRPRMVHNTSLLDSPNPDELVKIPTMSPEKMQTPGQSPEPHSRAPASSPASPPSPKPKSQSQPRRSASAGPKVAPFTTPTPAVPAPTRTATPVATPTATPKATPGSSPTKPESLNPRFLKKAPAGHDTRFLLVKALHDQYARLNTELKKNANAEEKKMVLSAQQLITRTLNEEEYVATTKPVVYANNLKNRIMQYKRMSLAQWKDERAKAIGQTEAKDAKSTAQEPPSPRPVETGLTESQEIDYLPRLVIPLTGHERYGYVTAIPSPAEIKAAESGVLASKNTEQCDRCSRRFQVFPGRREDGALASNGACVYHPGKKYFVERGPGDKGRPQQRYRCCQRSTDDESPGCTQSPTHVFKTTHPARLASVLNFAETPENPTVPKDRAVCFDCEMGYTVYGLELLRLTVVSWPKGEELLDILVKPMGETLDLNTRYSGVHPADMVNAERWQPGMDPSPTLVPSSVVSSSSSFPTSSSKRLKIVPSPSAARSLFFGLVGPRTPLIGHGMENDLNALRVIHPTCIDTVLLYPHRRGLPIRHGLKYLMEVKLGRKIQVDPATAATAAPAAAAPAGAGAGGGSSSAAAAPAAKEGHDSAEDARAAGDLVRLKIKESWAELRRKGWAVRDGKISPPQ